MGVGINPSTIWIIIEDGMSQKISDLQGATKNVFHEKVRSFLTDFYKKKAALVSDDID